MKHQTRKIISFLLVLVQLIALFPLGMTTAKAENTADGQVPVLNETIVGTVKFQSFNFLGDNDTGEDGTDYKTTFYYSDDYFSPSAINDNPNITDPEQTWEMLDNPSLAACSMDFAVASYTSAIDDVLSQSTQTWRNANYNRWISADGYEGLVKERNVREFLAACKFSGIECTDMDKRPTNDSIGYTIANKQITVWDSVEETNKTYTLVAVGVRGAGYGAEWASNISIGDQNGNLPNGRHYGFDSSAQKICSSIQTYLSDHNITGEVKYWVTGFSRAAAVANLVAGYLTDDGSIYQTQKKDVYGYTWECPQAASTIGENALDYKNIHNILNPMDAVPKVSPSEFNHQRLGVDYQMPYHGNVTSTTQNDTLYRQMFEVLKTVAVGNGTDPDPLVDDKTTSAANDGYVSPAKYPYNSKITIYKMTVPQLLSDALNDNLMTNFGTVTASNNMSNSNKLLGRTTNGLYLDQFVDDLIDIFLTSNAWVGGTGNNRTPMQNRATFINNYQSNFRTLLGYFLDYSGPAFMDMVDKLMDAVTAQFKISNAGFGLAFLNFYNDPTGSYTGISNLAYRLTSWWGKAKKDVLISEAKSVAVDTANDLTNGFTDPQGITRAQMNAAMQDIVGLVINLYAYELDAFESQYLGTSMRYLNTILCTHEQETVLSWIMSLDPNHMNRSSRTITIPAGCDATVYEYREQYAQYEGSMDDAEARAPVVAELKNGALDSKDGRITLYQENGSYVIRYPASLQIRVDVKPTQTVNLNGVAVDDYETLNAYTAVSDGADQFLNKPLAGTYNSITQRSDKTNAAAKNTLLSRYGTIEPGDTLHVLVSGMQTFNSGDTAYDLIVDKAPSVTVQDYAAGGGLTSGTDAASAVLLGGSASNSTDAEILGIRTRQTVMTVPASSIYYDDELTGNGTSGYAGATTRLDWNAETQQSVGKLFWYKFRGTRIDLYCTTDSATGYVSAEIYENNNGEVGDRVDIQAVKSSSQNVRYNVPTISFDGLDANTDYFLRLYAIKGANYRLDGIRVYHSADETDSAVKAAYEAAGEQDAKYVNLRALLLGEVSEETLADNNAEGAVFYTDSGTSYALASSEYQNDSPKNEIYLKPGEKVAFQIVGEYEKVAVGLSAPESKTGTWRISVTNGQQTKTLTINGALDQYYTIQPATDGSVVIRNNSTAMIAITNVKLSGNYTAPVTGQSLEAPLMVSKSLMRYAASFSTLADTAPVETAAPEETPAPTEDPVVTPSPELTPTPAPTPAPTPTPTNPSSDSSVMQLISSFVRSLFDGFSRLFRP